jgi:DNA mismatch endonuclease, patch repair protein
MTDNLTPEQRSYSMSQIRSRGNKSTEQALASAMRKGGISGWRRNILLFGKPDFVFRKPRVVVFVDGCFWHGCERCGLSAKSNTEYWLRKISRNKERDQRTTRELRQTGWKVVRIWEHDLEQQPAICLSKIRSALKRALAARLQAPEIKDCT